MEAVFVLIEGQRSKFYFTRGVELKIERLVENTVKRFESVGGRNLELLPDSARGNVRNCASWFFLQVIEKLNNRNIEYCSRQAKIKTNFPKT